MKKLTSLSILMAAMISFTACEEEGDSVKVDFEIIVTGESPNAIVQINNTSDETDSFIWNFSEGANVKISTDLNPQLIVDKAGEFTVTLKAIIGFEEKTQTKTVNIAGVNKINSYDDVIIGRLKSKDYGDFFSCKTGNVYFTYSVSMQKTDIIDFSIYYEGFIDFGSPWMFTNFYTTPFFNYNLNNEISVADFDKLSLEEEFNKELEFPETSVDIQLEEIPKIIPFKCSDGKFGLIKIQELYPEYFLMDVKVTKYY